MMITYIDQTDLRFETILFKNSFLKFYVTVKFLFSEKATTI